MRTLDLIKTVPNRRGKLSYFVIMVLAFFLLVSASFEVVQILRGLYRTHTNTLYGYWTMGASLVIGFPLVHFLMYRGVCQRSLEALDEKDVSAINEMAQHLLTFVISVASSISTIVAIHSFFLLFMYPSKELFLAMAYFALFSVLILRIYLTHIRKKFTGDYRSDPTH